MKRRIEGLYAIVDTTFSPQYTHAELAEKILEGGCDILQLRIKRPKGSSEVPPQVMDAARKISELKKRFDFTFIVNDYVDIAVEINADGIHVGSDDTRPDEIRRKVGDRFLIGYSSHSLEEAKRAASLPVDYVALGAIYPTKTKGPGHPVQGIDILKQTVTAIDKPLVAIGGITRSNIHDVLSTGVASVAMITALSEAHDVTEETKWYVKQMQDRSR